MKGFFIISIIVVVASILLLTAHPHEHVNLAEADLPNMLSASNSASAPTYAPAPVVKRVVTQEVRLTEDGFFPAVYNVNAGNQLDLFFLLEEAEFVSIEDADVAEYVQAGAISVTLPAGEYSMVCHSCDDPHVATIVVN